MIVLSILAILIVYFAGIVAIVGAFSVIEKVMNEKRGINNEDRLY